MSFKIIHRDLDSKNNWVNLQLGRGREGWGAGSNIHLAMNDKSKPYDYFKLSSNYGNLRVSYIHGFLEKLEIILIDILMREVLSGQTGPG